MINVYNCRNNKGCIFYYSKCTVYLITGLLLIINKIPQIMACIHLCMHMSCIHYIQCIIGYIFIHNAMYMYSVHVFVCNKYQAIVAYWCIYVHVCTCTCVDVPVYILYVMDMTMYSFDDGSPYQ